MSGTVDNLDTFLHLSAANGVASGLASWAVVWMG
jgi:hypothetical protein